MKEARSRLIVAVDVPDRIAALSAVDQLSGHVGYFKLGLEIFASEGPALVREIVNRGELVFLDLKLHDIPNTVAGAVRSACRLGVGMLTLHAAGGRKMLEAARDAAQGSSAPPLLLAVTALTSLTADDVRSIGIEDPVATWVERLAEIAFQVGIPGLVASPLELPVLYRKFGGTIKFVIPGIRPGANPPRIRHVRLLPQMLFGLEPTFSSWAGRYFRRRIRPGRRIGSWRRSPGLYRR